VFLASRSQPPWQVRLRSRPTNTRRPARRPSAAWRWQTTRGPWGRPRWPGPPAVTSRTSGAHSLFFGVSANSSSDVWAVGSHKGGYNQLILHWNGTAWSKVLAHSSVGFYGVSADSGNDAWAVGDMIDSTSGNFITGILHWNGTNWLQVASPNPSSIDDELYGVGADSASDAWAVGTYYSAPAYETLILHWNGTAWTMVASPNPSSEHNSLEAVSADSASDAWAAGATYNTTTDSYDTLILHWNGSAWTRVASPNPSPGSALSGVSADSASDAWAVGNTDKGALILHWNGSAWTKVASPHPSLHGSYLAGVSAVSRNDVWAVGGYTNHTTGVEETLILHWNGSAWTKVASPSVSSSNNHLEAVSADSSGDAWAAGYAESTTTIGAYTRLLLHWNGTSWRRT
jgi:hypothetical protein